VRFKIDGEVFEAAEDIRVRELVEAEKALGFSLDETGSAGKMAIGIFVAMRRMDAEIGPGMLADKVMAVDLSKYEEVEDAGPPAVGATTAPVSQRISGVPDLEASVSRSVSGI